MLRVAPVASVVVVLDLAGFGGDHDGVEPAGQLDGQALDSVAEELDLGRGGGLQAESAAGGGRGGGVADLGLDRHGVGHDGTSFELEWGDGFWTMWRRGELRRDQ